MALTIYKRGNPWPACNDPLVAPGRNTLTLTTKAFQTENQITATDLYQLVKTRELTKKQAYVTALDRCFARVRRCASVGRYECMFTVPSIIVGKPMYDLSSCTDFVVSEMMKNGFTVLSNSIDPTILHIHWDQ